MRTTHTLFCDETGNTGSRFLDPAQPMFAEGGWFISHEKRPDAMAAVERIEEKLRSNGVELKGKNLLRSSRGRALIREVCEAVAQNGGVPYIHVVEKRYFVCSKIVETFFDPNFNPRVDPSETFDPEKRREDAQRFYDSTGLLVDEFAEPIGLRIIKRSDKTR